MDNVPNIFTRKFIGIHFDGQNFGHVDCEFTPEVEYDLGPKWNLVDSKGNTNVVSYNMDLQYLVIIECCAHL